MSTAQLTKLETQRPRKAEKSGPSVLSILVAFLAVVLVPGLIAFGLATVNELQVVAVILGVLGVLAILARPFWGMIICVGLIYIRPEEAISALQGMRFTLLVSVVTLVAMLLQFSQQNTRLVRTPLNGLLSGFAITVVLSSLSYGNTGTAITDISKLLIFAFLVINLVRTPHTYRQFVTAVLVLSSYLAVYSIHLYFSGAVINDQGTIRTLATGIFGDPNDLAATVVAGLALALSRIPQASKSGKALLIALGLIMIWAILLTNSRGGMMALLAVLGGFFLMSQRRKGVAILLAAIIVGAFLAATPGRMTNFNTGEASANSRFWFWDNGVDQLIQHPLLGVGYGQFPSVNGGYTAHNSFVLCFGELGLLGYFCWMGCIYHCFRRPEGAGEVVGLEAEDIQRNLLGARLALLGFLVASFWLSHTYTPILYLLISLAIAGPLALYPPLESLPGKDGNRLRDGAKIAALCLGSIIFIKLLAEHCK
jgi:O-antigen ligase